LARKSTNRTGKAKTATGSQTPTPKANTVNESDRAAKKGAVAEKKKRAVAAKRGTAAAKRGAVAGAAAAKQGAVAARKGVVEAKTRGRAEKEVEAAKGVVAKGLEAAKGVVANRMEAAKRAVAKRLEAAKRAVAAQPNAAKKKGTAGRQSATKDAEADRPTVGGSKAAPVKKARRTTAPPPKNNYVLVILDSCRFDSFTEANTKTFAKLGPVERRWSYASWTAPSHYNLMTGLLPHTSPPHVYSSEYYKQDFAKYSERLGVEGIRFRSFIPELWLPTFLRKQGYRTHARVSLPVISQYTNLNHDFNSFRLMPSHNDMRAMLQDLFFTDDRPSFWLLNVGETHYPYATPDEPENDWPRLSGVHGVLKRLDDAMGDDDPRFFDRASMKKLRGRQIATVSYLDRVMEELFDVVPKNTYITVTADHGELFGEGGYFGHGPIQHEKVIEVPFLEGKIR